MSEAVFEESCGFNKWSLGVDKNCSIVVKFNHHPNHGQINLYDIVGDDLERLAEMFRKANEYYKASAIVSKAERGEL